MSGCKCAACNGTGHIQGTSIERRPCLGDAPGFYNHTEPLVIKCTPCKGFGYFPDPLPKQEIFVEKNIPKIGEY